MRSIVNRNDTNRINIIRSDAKRNDLIKNDTLLMRNRPIKSVSVKSTTQRTNIFKVKYKQYRHPSVQNVFGSYNNIILPSEILSLNINPRITLNGREVYNWYAKQLKNRMKKLLYTSITQNESGKNYKITCRCCTDTSEVNTDCAQQLQSLKENLLDFVIKKSNDNLNYQVVRLQRSHVPKPKQQTDDSTCRIVKKLKVTFQTNEDKQSPHTPKKRRASQSQSNEHVSIQKIRNTFKNINIPKQMCKTNVDPLVILNSGEVLEWFTYHMDSLKNKFSDVEDIINDIMLTEKNAHSSRQSKAKSMNFCEIDSSDYESDKEERRKLRRRGSAAHVNKPCNTDIITESVHKSNFDKLIHLFNSIKENTSSSDVPNEPINNISSEHSQQTVQIGQKRLLSNELDVNEIEQKKKKYYCSRITVNSSSEMDTTPSTSEQVQDINNIACCVCGDEVARSKLGDHVKKHLQCKRCKKKLKTLEALLQHFSRHCIVNYSNNLPHLKLRRIDTVEAIVKKYPSAFDDVEDANLNNERSVVNKVTSITSKPSSRFCVKNLYVNKRSHSKESSINSNALSATNIQGRCIRTYSKKVPISSPAQQLIDVTSASENPPVLHLKNTINSNLNKILVLSNNVSSPSNVVYGRVFVNSVGQSSTVHITSATPATDPSSKASNSQFVQIVENSTAQNSVLEELQDHSYHQQQTVISVGNNINQYVIMPGSSANATATSTRDSVITATESTSNQDAQDPLEISENETTNKQETDGTNSLPAKGQFKIRVKSLQELS
ncbi:hypothetical protein ILUMI_22801 [Ignelater luminosus]|uniref:C2H2-type domain-containing protein n=1 Tax=Ignelater luminosus TaxID=2038154 RepID=A0A8K0CA01_IGNLU|nr:hypothetical protein ILUMI_22801 [Ignelater luminosus]